jgi:hypothetical protein
MKMVRLSFCNLLPRFVLVFATLLSLHNWCSGQVADTTSRPDSAGGRRHQKDSPYKVDSVTKRVRNPRKATLYSTFFPGLGQIYNHKYWKVPIVWAAVGIPAYTFFYNRSWYNNCQKAISIIDTYQTLGTAIPDSLYKTVDPKLRTFLQAGDDNSLRSYRNEYRKDEDYSVLFFILFWGLNIVDATVDAHLASFDVGNNLSFHFDQPSPNAMVVGPMGTGMGVSLVVDFHKARYKRLPVMP